MYGKATLIFIGSSITALALHLLITSIVSHRLILFSPNHADYADIILLASSLSICVYVFLYVPHTETKTRILTITGSALIFAAIFGIHVYTRIIMYAPSINIVWLLRPIILLGSVSASAFFAGYYMHIMRAKDR